MNRNIEMISTARHRFEGRELRTGDSFRCTEAEAADLEALRFAMRKPQHIGNRSLEAEQQQQVSQPHQTQQRPAQQRGGRGSRNYGRRDLATD